MLITHTKTLRKNNDIAFEISCQIAICRRRRRRTQAKPEMNAEWIPQRWRHEPRAKLVVSQWLFLFHDMVLRRDTCGRGSGLGKWQPWKNLSHSIAELENADHAWNMELKRRVSCGAMARVKWICERDKSTERMINDSR